MLNNNRLTDRIDGAVLKYTAVLAMLTDHIAYTAGFYSVMDETVYTLMRAAGRISFPLFCYLLTEGFRHTKDVRGYALRLAAGAVISEVPYDLCFFGRVWAPQSQNVFFTLLISLIMLLVLNGIREPYGVLLWLKRGLAVLLACAVSEAVRGDYGWEGPVITAAFFFLRLRLYNGERGRQNRIFFYLFYPAHLLLLWMFWKLR